jgi:hypothetical protein
MNRDVIFGEAWVHDPTVTVVKKSLLHQGQAQTHDDAAAKLTARGLGIDDAPGVEGTQEAADACFAGDATDPHFAEHRAIRMHRPVHHLER